MKEQQPQRNLDAPRNSNGRKIIFPKAEQILQQYIIIKQSQQQQRKGRREGGKEGWCNNIHVERFARVHATNLCLQLSHFLVQMPSIPRRCLAITIWPFSPLPPLVNLNIVGLQLKLQTQENIKFTPIFIKTLTKTSIS